MQGQSMLSKFLFEYLMSMSAWEWAFPIVAVAYMMCIWKIAQEYKIAGDVKLMLGRSATMSICAGMFCAIIFILAGMSDESRRSFIKMVLKSMVVI